MNKTRTNHPARTAAGFQWPSAADLGVICAQALMPYLLACILLAV